MKENIIACPPFNRRDQIALGIVEFKPGADAAITSCGNCRMNCYIGPGQRAALAAEPKTKVFCFRCAMLAAPGSTVASLGGEGGTFLTQTKLVI